MNSKNAQNTSNIFELDHLLTISNGIELPIEKHTDYTRVREADIVELSILVEKAKGPNRSLRQFATELGTSPATIHRIIKMKNNLNCRDELIFKIAELADPNSGVTLQALLAAQGLEKKRDTRVAKYLNSTVEKQKSGTIISIIKSKGFSAVKSTQIYTNSNFKFDSVIESDAVGKDVGLWAFDFNAASTSNYPSGPSAIVRWFDKVMAMLYRSELFVDKISYVVEERTEFDQIVNRVKDYFIPDEISIILLKDNAIKDEFIIPMISHNPKSIFKD